MAESVVERVQLPNGTTFDAVQWEGDTAVLPEWLGHCYVEDDPFHGKLLMGVGQYRVRPGSWVLKSDQRGDVFPVPRDMFRSTYDPIPS